jgi:hypothetical protein
MQWVNERGGEGLWAKFTLTLPSPFKGEGNEGIKRYP